MMMSGSARTIERRPAANVSPVFGFTCTCLTPVSSYSTGSSTVMIVFSGVLTVVSPAYSVVVLPEPVGPVTRIAPWVACSASWKRARSCSDMPSTSRSMTTASLSRMRITTDSPRTTGSVATRRSTWWPSTASPMRPSCGTRRSAMSRLAMILTRDTRPATSWRGTVVVSKTTPSTR